MKNRYILLLVFLFTNFTLGFSQRTSIDKPKIPANFPSDCIVTEHCLSCETADSLIFFPDRTLIFRLGGIEETQKHYELGIWRLEGNIIKIDIYKILGIRPVGSPTNPDVRFAANPEDYYVYEEYVPFEKWVIKSMTFDAETIDYDYICLDSINSSSNINIDLKKYHLNGDYKVASCRLVKNIDLEDLSKTELRLMRNEIFARYGYKFKSIDLQKHFLSKDWYNGFASNVDEYLTDIEKKNIKLIREFEQK